MREQIYLNEAEKYLIEGKIKYCISVLKENIKNQLLRSQLIQTESRYNILIRRINSGIISFSDEQIEQNKIISSLSYIISQISIEKEDSNLLVKRVKNHFGIWQDIHKNIHREPFSDTRTYEVIKNFGIVLKNGSRYDVKKGYFLYTEEKVLEGSLTFFEIPPLEEKKHDSLLGDLLGFFVNMSKATSADQVIINWEDIQSIQ